MRVGTQLDPRGDIAHQARHAEDVGFDYLHAGEHVVFHNEQTSALISLAAAAAVTRSIRIMSSVVLAPLYPAAVLAWLAMSLDRVSKGRLDLGIGLGGEFAEEFQVVGVDPSERGALTDEFIQVARLLWSGERVSFDGRFIQFQDVTMRATPHQRRLPIWIGGRSKAGMRRAAAVGDGWMPYMYSPEKVESSLGAIRSYAAEHGRTPGSVAGGVFAFTAVYRSSTKARETAAQWISGLYRQDLHHVVDRYLVAGSPAEAVERLQLYQRAGAEVALLPLACPPEERFRMRELIASEVLPAIHHRDVGEVEQSDH